MPRQLKREEIDRRRIILERNGMLDWVGKRYL